MTRLFKVATLLSMAIFLAVLAMFVRSYWVGEGFSIRAPANRYVVVSSRGSLVFYLTLAGDDSADSGKPRSAAWRWVRDRDPPDYSRQPLTGPVRDIHLSVSRFAMMRGRGVGSAGYWTSYWFVLPDSVLTTITALLPTISLIRLRQLAIRRRRIAANECAECGYDLRASNGRCPECGVVVATVAAWTSLRYDESLQ